jgi:hypothetical protein
MYMMIFGHDVFVFKSSLWNVYPWLVYCRDIGDQGKEQELLMDIACRRGIGVQSRHPFVKKTL